MEQVYMTVLTSENYIKGVKGLKNSLKKVKSSHDLVVLIPEEARTVLKNALIREKIEDDFCHIAYMPQIVTDAIGEKAERFIKGSGQAYWLNTFFKLQVMSCTQYKKIVLLDSDMLILRNIDDLFEKPAWSAVVSTKCVMPQYVKFNSGLLVLEPNEKEYRHLLASIAPAVERKLREGKSAGDQDVFQEAYPDWEEHQELNLPETYNAVWFCIEELCRYYSVRYGEIKVVHFTGPVKPFQKSRKENIRTLLSYLYHLQFWRYKT